MNGIEVKCFATLAEHSPAGGRLKTKEGATIADVLQILRIPTGEVAVIFVNGIHAEENSVLHDGDRLGLFPPVGGG